MSIGQQKNGFKKKKEKKVRALVGNLRRTITVSRALEFSTFSKSELIEQTPAHTIWHSK